MSTADEQQWTPFPERVDRCPGRVRIIADKREGKTDLVYYDRLHTGSSYDELQVSLDDGKCVRGPASLFEQPSAKGV